MSRRLNFFAPLFQQIGKLRHFFGHRCQFVFQHLRKIIFGFLLIILSLMAIVLGFLLFVYFYPWRTLLILQNSDEVRATGGFFGSLALIEHQGHQLKQLTFFDVYDLDSQLTNYPPAPFGVRSYLSGGQDALHLQDANWDRDFPTSAERIATMLQKHWLEPIHFIVAVNAQLIQNYLATYGEIALTQDGETLLVNEKNFTTLARKDHQIFNPQRQEKTIFLRLMLTALKNNWRQQGGKFNSQLFAFLRQQFISRQIQIYATNPLYQSLIAFLGIDGATKQPNNCQRLYYVESNVGINKSNAHTHTTFSLTPIVNKKTTLSITINNDNVYPTSKLVTKRLHYANFARLLLPPKVVLQAWRINGESTMAADINYFQDSQGNSWQEQGLLVLVAEQSSATLEADLVSEQDCLEVVN